MSKQSRPRKLFLLTTLWFLLVLFVSVSFAGLFNPSDRYKVEAATSSTINFQARLLTDSGDLVPDGNYHVEFKLYNTSSSSGSSQGSCSGDSNCVWTETRTTGNLVRVVNGYLTVNLGSVTSFGSSIEWDQEHWLGINIGGNVGSASWDGEMSPRLKLTSVPYAKTAGKLVATDSGNRATLGFTTPTGNRSLLLPDESGTLCIQGSSNCGFVGTGDFTLQGAYDGGNTITTSDATDLSITLADTSTDANFLINAVSGTDGRFAIQAAGTDTFSVSSTGAVVSKNSSDSTTAFQIQNASGTSLFRANTTDSEIIVENATLIASDIDAPSGSSATISRTNRTSSSSSTGIGTSSFTPGGTFTPNANRLLVAYVFWESQNQDMATDGSDVTVSGGSLTWTPITGQFNRDDGWGIGHRAFYAFTTGSPPSNMQVTVDAGSEQVERYHVAVDEMDGVDLANPTDGAVSDSRQSDDNDTWTDNLGATPAADDWKVSVGSIEEDSNGVWDTPSGWTEIHSLGQTPDTTVIYDTGSTSTTLNYDLGNLEFNSNTDTTYGGFILKADPGSATIELGATNATQINIGSTGSAIQFSTDTNGVNFQGSNSATAFQIQDSGASNTLFTADTSNNRVIIGDGDDSSGANSTLFVVDSASTSNAPTGVNGGIFYDTTLNKFRCYQDSDWTDCIGAGSTIEYFAATKNSTTQSLTNSYADITNWDQDHSASAYTFNGSTGVLTFNDNALYEITVDVQHDNTSVTSRVQLDVKAQEDTGSGFADNTALKWSNYSARDSTQDEGGISTSWVKEYSSGDDIKILAKTIGNTPNIPQDYARIYIVKKTSGVLSSGVSDLQGAYNGGNTILTTDGNDVAITLANTTTDPNFIIDIASSSSGEFKVQNNGTDVLQVGSAGQLQLDVQGSSGGILLGGDAQIYRSDNDELSLGQEDSLIAFNGDGDYLSFGADSDSAYIYGSNDSSSDWLLAGKVAGDGNERIILRSDGTLNWGGGSSSYDTNLYRSAADTLQTDGNLIVGNTGGSQTLTINGSLGAISTSSTGNNLNFSRDGGNYIEATDASGSLRFGAGGNSNNIILDTDGSALFQNSSDSTDAFRIYNSSGSRVVSVDTTNSTVGIGSSGAVSNAKLYIETGNNAFRVNQTGTGNLIQLQRNSDDAVVVDSDGRALFRTLTGSDSTTAFRIQNSGSEDLFTADTVNTKVEVAGDVNVGNRYGNRLFSDNFESGSFSLWDDGGDGDISISQTEVHNGKYSAELDPDSTVAEAETTIAESTTAYLRAWVYVDSQTSTNADLISLEDDDNDGTSYWTVYRNGTSVQLYNGVADSFVGSGSGFTADEWHLIEMRITIGSGTGTSQVWLDGTQVINASSQNNGTNLIDTAVIGDENNREFTAYIDDVAADTISTGTPSSLIVDDSLHIGGTATFGNSILLERPGADGTIKINVDGDYKAGLQLWETNDRGFNLYYDADSNQFALQANDGGFLSEVMTVSRTTGATLFQSSDDTDNDNAFQVQNASGDALFNINAEDGGVAIGSNADFDDGRGILRLYNEDNTNGYGTRILFGDGNLSGSQNVWIGEHGSDDSDQLQLHAANGTYITGEYDGSVEIANFFSDTSGIWGSGVNALAVAQFNSRAVFGYDGSTQDAIIQGNSGKGIRFYTDGNDSSTYSALSIDDDGASVFRSYNDVASAFEVQYGDSTPIFTINTDEATIDIDANIGIGADGNFTDKLYLESGAYNVLTANGTSSNDLLHLQSSGNDVLTVDNSGNLIAGGSATGTTATTSGTGTSTTTVNLTGSAFSNGDIIFINNAGQDYYTRIVSGGGTSTLTVSPAVTYENSRTVTKYLVQNIGSDSSGTPSSNNDRFFQGYFTGGIVAGAGSTTYSDGNINSAEAFQITAPSVDLGSSSSATSLNVHGATSFQADSTAAFQIQDSSSDSLFNIDSSNKDINVGGTVATPAVPPSGGGTVGSWSTGTSLTTAVYGATSVAYDGYIYNIGGNDGSGPIDSVYYASLNPSTGAVGSWSSTTSLPDTIYNASSVVYDGYVYVIGGNDGSSGSATVYYAPINGNGTLGSWNTTTSLVAGIDVQLASAVIYDGYVYLVGGASSYTSGDAWPYVQSAEINGNGTLGSWSISGTMPVSRAGAPAVVSNGYIYEIGGTTGSACGDTNENTVYYAPLSSGGSVGTWNTTTSMIYGRFGSPAVAWGGYIYNLSGTGTGGGCGSAGVTNLTLQLNPDGTVGTSSLTTGAYGGWQSTAVAYNGYMYELGGTTNGSNTLSTVKYTSVSGDQGSDATSNDGNSVNLTVNGKGLFQASSDSTTAFQIQNSSGSEQLTVDTTNSRVYIGDTTADSTASLLVLDTKNTLSDPTCVNGGVYYNSASNQAKICINSSWAAVGVPRVTSLPGSPADGDEVYYEFDRGDGTDAYWHLRYNSGTTYWDYLGGPSLRVKSSSNPTTSSNSYQTSNAPSTTLPLDGDYTLGYGAADVSSGVSGDNGMRVALYYNGSINDNVLVRGDIYTSSPVNYNYRSTGLTSGNTIQTRYKSDASQSSTFYGLFVDATPIRVQ